MLERLREKEADLSTQYAQATTQFGSAYPRVVELNNQLKQMRTRDRSRRDENAGGIGTSMLYWQQFSEKIC